jgi:tRNA/rRNA methyltransferase
MTTRARLEHAAIVLNKPRFPENIGAAARAVCNMGIGQLVVVSPENDDPKPISALATHAAADVVENMLRFDNLAQALAGYHYVVGTTARLGGQRQVVVSPEQMAQQLIPITQQNQVALLFGPEDRGLSNVDIRSCHILVNIPTAEFSSLNLAQAVMVMCYEMFRFSLDKPAEFLPRLANQHELAAMYDQLKEVLMRISFINPDNPDYFMNNLRHFFARMQLRAKEVQIIRGICRQVNWYGKKCYKDGLQDRKTDTEA